MKLRRPVVDKVWTMLAPPACPNCDRRFAEIKFVARGNDYHAGRPIAIICPACEETIIQVVREGPAD